MELNNEQLRDLYDAIIVCDYVYNGKNDTIVSKEMMKKHNLFIIDVSDKYPRNKEIFLRAGKDYNKSDITQGVKKLVHDMDGKVNASSLLDVLRLSIEKSVQGNDLRDQAFKDLNLNEPSEKDVLRIIHDCVCFHPWFYDDDNKTLESPYLTLKELNTPIDVSDRNPKFKKVFFKATKLLEEIKQLRIQSLKSIDLYDKEEDDIWEPADIVRELVCDCSNCEHKDKCEYCNN